MTARPTARSAEDATAKAATATAKAATATEKAKVDTAVAAGATADAATATDAASIATAEVDRTERLTKVIIGSFALIVALCVLLSYSYLRVAGQVDALREERGEDKEVISDLSARVAEDSAVLAEVRSVVVLFAELFAGEFDRDEARRRLTELSERLRAQEAARQAERERGADQATSSTTTTSSTSTTTTTTTRPQSSSTTSSTTSTTTTTVPCRVQIGSTCVVH